MPDEGNIRKTLAVITWVQLALGIGAVVCGCLAVVFTLDQVGTSGPPYFIGTFVGAGLVLVTRVCLVLAIVGCVVGVIFNVVLGLIQCDPRSWLSACYFNQNTTENKIIVIVTICLLSASMIISFWAVCYRGLSFMQKCNNAGQPEVHRSSGFQPVEMFDIEERNSDNRSPAIDYDKTSSFRQTSDDDAAYHGAGYQEPLRQKHVPPAQQSRNYVAVLNDPAMKQKLQERSNRLQT